MCAPSSQASLSQSCGADARAASSERKSRWSCLLLPFLGSLSGAMCGAVATEGLTSAEKLCEYPPSPEAAAACGRSACSLPARSTSVRHSRKSLPTPRLPCPSSPHFQVRFSIVDAMFASVTRAPAHACRSSFRSLSLAASSRTFARPSPSSGAPLRPFPSSRLQTRTFTHTRSNMAPTDPYTAKAENNDVSPSQKCVCQRTARSAGEQADLTEHWQDRGAPRHHQGVQVRPPRLAQRRRPPSLACDGASVTLANLDLPRVAIIVPLAGDDILTEDPILAGAGVAQGPRIPVHRQRGVWQVRRAAERRARQLFVPGPVEHRLGLDCRQGVGQEGRGDVRLVSFLPCGSSGQRKLSIMGSTELTRATRTVSRRCTTRRSRR